MVRLVEERSINPKCPHCKNQLNTVSFKELEAFLGKRYIYFCPHCHSTLGISHRKGFWMG